MSRPIAWSAAALAAALAVAAIVFLLERAPSGPVEPAWDRQACAHCRMHLSERGFASQLHTEEGEVLFFDDPGCLFLWQAERGVEAAAIYHHHLREERWLAESETGFVRVDPTPMAWGFGAVERNAPGALAPEAARREVLRSRGAASPTSRMRSEEEGHGQPAH
jgi:copper chaperone NosL